MTTFYLLYVVRAPGVRSKKIIRWILLGFVQSIVLFICGNREGLDLTGKQRFLFLWAGQILTWFFLILRSLQDSSSELDDSLKKS
ncbi:hypothetical protein CORC01_11564 [Colletotrichum orchidophilum]|uniref:Uncharacterized protein n=1 Tax=Colletotrichum orchidophilum TaxID=1209926 RepID=A0A1G4AVS2_9PEZI|nr:uncharacterized protein CORC01_11564 [Colletotrichum orchidophilum]OHE93152.1 hypothetical protein CORC01_11564 [Colletotrichum orchidophilum]